MKCLSTPTVAQLAARLHKQALEVAVLRLAVDIQSWRLAQSQLDERFILPHRRQSLPGFLMRAPSRSDGDSRASAVSSVMRRGAMSSNTSRH